MTYLELLDKADRLLNANKITIGEWEKMIMPLHRQVLPDFLTEIVRCEECKYWNGEGYYCDYDMQGRANDFCSWAKRRADDETGSLHS